MDEARQKRLNENHENYKAIKELEFNTKIKKEMFHSTDEQNIQFAFHKNWHGYCFVCI